MRKRRGLSALAAVATMAVGVLISVLAPVTPAQAEIGQGCGSWQNVGGELQRLKPGTQLPMVGIRLQRQQCVFGPDVVWHIRVQAQSYSPGDEIGKIYSAVALYRGSKWIDSWVRDKNAGTGAQWAIPVGEQVNFTSHTLVRGACYRTHLHLKYNQFGDLGTGIAPCVVALS